jgi:Fic family protein
VLLPEREEGEVSVAEYAKLLGLAKKKAEYELNKAVDEGKLSRRKVGIRGRKTTVYRPK